MAALMLIMVLLWLAFAAWLALGGGKRVRSAGGGSAGEGGDLFYAFEAASDHAGSHGGHGHDAHGHGDSGDSGSGDSGSGDSGGGGCGGGCGGGGGD